jgi:hypothetical protein
MTKENMSWEITHCTKYTIKMKTGRQKHSLKWGYALTLGEKISGKNFKSYSTLLSYQ